MLIPKDLKTHAFLIVIVVALGSSAKGQQSPYNCDDTGWYGVYGNPHVDCYDSNYLLDCDSTFCVEPWTECIVCSNSGWQGYCIVGQGTGTICAELKDADGCGTQAFGYCEQIGEERDCVGLASFYPARPCCRSLCGG